MPHLLGVRLCVAAGAHLSTRRGIWTQAMLSSRRYVVHLFSTLPSSSLLLSLEGRALQKRVEEAASSVPSAALRAFGLFVEDLRDAAPTLSLWVKLLTFVGLETHLASHRILQQDLALSPSIAATPLRPPIFIVGLPRTGTTLLHHLLALDPDSQCLRAYELMRPSRSAQGLIPIAIIDFLDWAKLAIFLRFAAVVAPQWPHQHDLDASSPEECLFALQRSLPLDTHYRTRSRLLGAYAADVEIPTSAYSQYRLFLQQVQTRRGSANKRYVLKGQLLHLQYLGPLRSTFPDAKVVWTHRPPVQVVGSLCSLRRSQQEVFTRGPVDLAEVGEGVLDYLSSALVAAMGELSETTHEDKMTKAGVEQLLHLQYSALVQDPIRTVEDLYAAWGWEVSQAHRDAMETYLARNHAKRAQCGRERARYHDACLEHYGLSSKVVDAHLNQKGVASVADIAAAFDDATRVMTHAQVARHIWRSEMA